MHESVIVNAVMMQAQHDYLQGNYPVVREDASQMCALQMQAEAGPTLLDQPDGLETYLEKFIVKQVRFSSQKFFLNRCRRPATSKLAGPCIPNHKFVVASCQDRLFAFSVSSSASACLHLTMRVIGLLGLHKPVYRLYSQYAISSYSYVIQPFVNQRYMEEPYHHQHNNRTRRLADCALLGADRRRACDSVTCALPVRL